VQAVIADDDLPGAGFTGDGASHDVDEVDLCAGPQLLPPTGSRAQRPRARRLKLEWRANELVGATSM